MLKRTKQLNINVLALTGLLIAFSSQVMAIGDPTSPYGYGAPKAKRGGLVLQSTAVSDGRRVAMINGRNYRVGQKVGRARVVDIQPYEVTLKRNGKTIHLRMLPRRTRIHSSGQKATK